MIKLFNNTLTFRNHGGAVSDSTIQLATDDAQSSHINIYMRNGMKNNYICAHPDDAKNLRDMLNLIYPPEPAVPAVTYSPYFFEQLGNGFHIKRDRMTTGVTTQKDKTTAIVYDRENAELMVSALNAKVAE